MGKWSCACGRVLAYPPEIAGRTVKCPACAALVDLPAEPARGAERPKFALQDELPGARAAAPPPEPLNDSSDAYQLSGTAPLPAAVYAAHAPRRRRAGDAVRPAAPPTPPPESLTKALQRVFTYPVTGNGLAALVTGVLFFGVARVVTFVMGYFPLIGGLVAMLLSLVLAGYMGGYLLAVIRSASKGEPEAPDWPDLMNYQETAIQPLLTLLLLGAMSLGPAYAVNTWAKGAPGWLPWLLLAVGLIYLPMGLLALARDERYEGLSPGPVLRGIAAVPRRYAMLWLFVLGIAAAQAGLNALVGVVMRMSALGAVFMAILGLIAQFYLLLAVGCALGLLYRSCEDRLKAILGPG